VAISKEKAPIIDANPIDFYFTLNHDDLDDIPTKRMETDISTGSDNQWEPLDTNIVNTTCPAGMTTFKRNPCKEDVPVAVPQPAPPTTEPQADSVTISKENDSPAKRVAKTLVAKKKICLDEVELVCSKCGPSVIFGFDDAWCHALHHGSISNKLTGVILQCGAPESPVCLN
jgi:hypothetical protein